MTTRKPMDTEQLRKRLRARLERTRERVDGESARLKVHLNACGACKTIGTCPDARYVWMCPHAYYIWQDIYEAIGRRKEAALVLREVSRGR